MAVFTDGFTVDSSLLSAPFVTGSLSGVLFPLPSHCDLGFAAGSQTTEDGFALWSDPVASTSFTATGYYPTRRFKSTDGTIDVGYATWWFDRMHVIPASEDVGTILSSVESSFYWHNAYRNTAQVLTGITVSGEGYEGTTITYDRTGGLVEDEVPINTPAQYGEGFTFTIPLEGSNVIDIDFDFEVESGVEAPSFNVVGSRAVIFPFVPQQPIDETIQFLTDIMEARDGTETRVSARANGRQSFRMNYLIDQQDPSMFQAAQALLVGKSGAPIGVGMWQQTQSTGTESTVSSTTITLDTTGMDLRAGGYAVLWRDWNDNEIVSVESFNATSITTASPLLGTWEAGTQCVPVQLCVAKDRLQMRRYQNNVAEFQIDWQSQDSTNTLEDYTDLYSTTYKDAPVLTDYHLMPGDVMPESYLRKFSVLDYGIGDRAYISDKAAPAVTTSRRWETDTLEDLMSVRRFIYWARGQQKSFWFPTHRHDFTISADLLAGDTQIEVVSNGYTAEIGVNAPWNFIQVTKNDGTTMYREILSSTADNDTGIEKLTIDSSPGVDYLAADISRICFLFRARFSSDTTKVTHTGRGIAGTGIGIIGIKQ